MHQAHVVRRDEGVRVLRRHRALGRHPRVPDGVRPAHLAHAEPRRDLVRQALVLEHLDRPSVAHDPDIGPIGGEPVDDPIRRSPDPEDRVVRPHLDPGRRAQRGGERIPERVPIVVRIRREQSELALGLGHRIVEDREAGAVGAAVRHAGEHRREPGAEPVPERRVLEKQSDDAAHRRLPNWRPET